MCLLLSRCKHCQRLAPTWEKFAQDAFNEGLPVGIATVDCTAEPTVCSKYKIGGFPTLQWFEKGDATAPRYNSDRTANALMGFVRQKMLSVEKYKEWEADPKKKAKYKQFDLHAKKNDHYGCQVQGYLMVHPVPGNFHIEAKSKDHSIDPSMTNMSHVVHHLSFGDNPFMGFFRDRETLKHVPEEHKRIRPMDDKVFHNSDYHQAHHHYIKVIPTVVDLKQTGGPLTFYQMLAQSQAVFYDAVNVPEARFSYDLSPMTVFVSKEGRKWYDYITSLCAIIGGTFTSLGLIDAVLYKVLKPKKL